eukprot:6205078-Pleurochrysis_carterae.AAC.1
MTRSCRYQTFHATAKLRKVCPTSRLSVRHHSRFSPPPTTHRQTPRAIDHSVHRMVCQPDSIAAPLATS